MSLSRLKQRIPVHYKELVRGRARKFGAKVEYAILYALLRPLEMISGRYVTFITRPKRARGDQRVSDAAERDYGEYAIVMQGPVVADDRFTVETLMLYKDHFPGAMLILSTWNTEDPRVICDARTQGIEVILSKPLENGGAGNINRQIHSSRVGIARAKERGAKYVLKTRCDQRFYNPRFLSLLSDTLRTFPAAQGVARGRIIGTNSEVGRKKVYFFTDYLFFGYTEDLERYFDVPFTDEPFGTTKKLEPWEFAEGYLCAHYTQKLGYPKPSARTTLEEYNTMLARHFCIVDYAILDMFWHKYHAFREHRGINYGYGKDLMGNFSYWLELYRREQNAK